MKGNPYPNLVRPVARRGSHPENAGKERNLPRSHIEHAFRRYFAVVFPLLIVAAAIGNGTHPQVAVGELGKKWIVNLKELLGNSAY